MKKQVKFPNALRTATLSAGLFLSASAFAQQVVVKGNVVDETGEPVIGASVKVVGGTLGTVTDIDGNFTLNADKKSTIEVTYIGYEPVKMQAGKNLTIHLKNTSSTLNEVVHRLRCCEEVGPHRFGYSSQARLKEQGSCGERSGHALG